MKFLLSTLFLVLLFFSANAQMNVEEGDQSGIAIGSLTFGEIGGYAIATGYSNGRFAASFAYGGHYYSESGIDITDKGVGLIASYLFYRNDKVGVGAFTSFGYTFGVKIDGDNDDEYGFNLTGTRFVIGPKVEMAFPVGSVRIIPAAAVAYVSNSIKTEEFGYDTTLETDAYAAFNLGASVVTTGVIKFIGGIELGIAIGNVEFGIHSGVIF